MATRISLAILLILSMLSASAAPAPSPAPPAAADREFKVFLPAFWYPCTIYTDRERPTVDIAAYLDGVRTDTFPYKIPVEIRLTVSDNCDPEPSTWIRISDQVVWQGQGSHTISHVFTFLGGNGIEGNARDSAGNETTTPRAVYAINNSPTIEVLSGPGAWENVSDHEEYVVRIEVGQPLEPIVLRFQDQNNDAMEAVLMNFPDGTSIVETPGTGLWTLTLPTDRSLVGLHVSTVVRAVETLRNDYFGSLPMRLSYQDTIPPTVIGMSSVITYTGTITVTYSEPVIPNLDVLDHQGRLRNLTATYEGSNVSWRLASPTESFIPGEVLTATAWGQDRGLNNVNPAYTQPVEVEWDPQAYVDMFLTGLNKAYFDNGIQGHITANYIIFGSATPNPDSQRFSDFVAWLAENNLNGATFEQLRTMYIRITDGNMPPINTELALNGNSLGYDTTRTDYHVLEMLLTDGHAGYYGSNLRIKPTAGLKARFDQSVYKCIQERPDLFKGRNPLFYTFILPE